MEEEKRINETDDVKKSGNVKVAGLFL